MEISKDILTIHLGTDIVYIPRIEAALNRFGDRFLYRVYTPGERQECLNLQSDRRVGVHPPERDRTSRPYPRWITYLAGRWAAKEAVVKALGSGFQGVRYTDIEIQRQPNGVPQICFSPPRTAQSKNWENCQWQLSLSHDGDYCVATAIALCPWS